MSNIGYNTNTALMCSEKIKILINNKNIFLTTDNILLLAFHFIAIDLNSKKLYKCTPVQFKVLKQHLKTVKEILISNE